MKKTSVLLADRHPALVESIRDLLETMFETVLMVSDENSLVNALELLVPDLVIVDLELPVTREQNVVTLLNRYDSELRFIVLSTQEGTEMIKYCKLSGASGYLLKRSSAEDLIKAVDAVQDGGVYFCPNP